MSERFKTTEKCVFSNLSDSLVKLADKFAQKTEDTGKLVWTCAKSTSLRRNAKEKEKTRKDLEDKIVNDLKKTDFYLSVNSAQWLL